MGTRFHLQAVSRPGSYRAMFSRFIIRIVVQIPQFVLQENQDLPRTGV